MTQHGSIHWSKKVKEQSEVREHDIVTKESCFETSNSKITFVCRRCKGKHDNVTIRAYVQTNSKHCSKCNTGRGQTRPHHMTPEQRANRGAVFAERGHRGPNFNRRGELHPNWTGTNRRREVEASPEWSGAVARQYRGKCFLTGSRENGCAHHLYARATYPEKRNDVNNGVWICEEAHRHFHNRYGQGSNTPEQFEEFATQYYNITEFPWRDENYNPPQLCEFLEAQAEGALRKKAKFETESSNKGHDVIAYEGGDYKNKDTLALFCCKKHGLYQWKSVFNYRRVKHGLECCIPKAHSWLKDNFFKPLATSSYSLLKESSEHATLRPETVVSLVSRIDGQKVTGTITELTVLLSRA